MTQAIARAVETVPAHANNPVSFTRDCGAGGGKKGDWMIRCEKCGSQNTTVESIEGLEKLKEDLQAGETRTEVGTAGALVGMSTSSSVFDSLLSGGRNPLRPPMVMTTVPPQVVIKVTAAVATVIVAAIKLLKEKEKRRKEKEKRRRRESRRWVVCKKCGHLKEL